MKQFKLIRNEYTDQGVRGLLTNDEVSFYTIERPWLNNAKMVSCIPLGNYLVKSFVTEKRGRFFMFMNVPDRTEILIHVANSYLDLNGCVGLGRKLGVVNGLPAVLESGIAIKNFMDYMKNDDEFMCEIVDEEKPSEEG